MVFWVFTMYVGFAQTIYNKDSLTILADSLHIEGDYKDALLIRRKALEKKENYSSDYTAYLQSKYYHTLSCDYEFYSYNYYNSKQSISKEIREKYLDSALTASHKAREIYRKVEKPDKYYLSYLQNRIYHQTAYRGNWKNALKEAKLGLSILEDTLTKQNKKYVDLIYDIGYIQSKLGDYSSAVEHFQTSLDLYQEIIGKDNNDVAQTYTDIAVEYRKLGLRKKELKSILEATKIWEGLNTDGLNNRFLYRCYRDLFNWYSYYGDFTTAKEYMDKILMFREKESKQQESFLRNSVEIYEDKLKEWHDFMIFYIRKKDTLKANAYKNYIVNSIDLNSELTKFETEIYSQTINNFSDISFDKNPEIALQSISKAIIIQEKYKKKYGSDPTRYKLKKADLLFELKKYDELLKLLNPVEQEIKRLNYSDLFKLLILQAKTYYALNQNGRANEFFTKALNVSLKKELPIEKVKYNDLKPLISFETIDGYISMGGFHFDQYNNKRKKEDLIKAFQCYFLASKLYNQLYLGQRYNDQLYSQYSIINHNLLKCAFESPLDQNMCIKAINEIENNGSKLAWSKFLFNNNKKNVSIPQDILNEEEGLKEQLNFYNKKLFNSNESNPEKEELWKNKISELELTISKISDSIKIHYNNYYQFNIQPFDVKSLQENLHIKSAFLKYVIANDIVYSLLITKDNIQINKFDQTNKFQLILKDFLNKISNRDQDYIKNIDYLKTKLFKNIPLNKLNKITIIPDDKLYYLPFEVLIFTESMPLISYATSLLLLKEQNNAIKNREVSLGVFTSSDAIERNKLQNANSFDLINVHKEVGDILKSFDGEIFPNSSKNTFLNQANKFDILHLAMHSTLNKSNPEFSSLNFYGEKENNQLFISDLYTMGLNADLVVLSSCNTGSGILEKGEGIISLSRAFTFAGIPSSVISLWKVPDKETSIIMKYFYQNLKKGESIDNALLQAKQEYLNNTDDILLKHPYFWAGFIVSGDTTAINSPTEYLFWSLIGIVLVLFIGFITKKLL